MYVPTLKQYIKEKIKILRELGISLTDYQLAYLKSLRSEMAVDRFAHSLIFNPDDVPTPSQVVPLPIHDDDSALKDEYTVYELSEFLKVSTRTIYMWVESGILKSYHKKVRRRRNAVRVPLDALLEFLETRPNSARICDANSVNKVLATKGEK